MLTELHQLFQSCGISVTILSLYFFWTFENKLNTVSLFYYQIFSCIFSNKIHLFKITLNNSYESHNIKYWWDVHMNPFYTSLSISAYSDGELLDFKEILHKCLVRNCIVWSGLGVKNRWVLKIMIYLNIWLCTYRYVRYQYKV